VQYSKSNSPSPDEPPSTGWQPVRVIDAAEFGPLAPKPTCDRCSRALRWVHVLCHPDWPTQLRVGCCCAKRLSFDYDAEAAEREAVGRANRFARFADLSRWQRSRTNKANLVRTIRIQGVKIKTTIFRKGNRYSFCLLCGGKTHFWKRQLDSQPDTIHAVFGVLERLRDGAASHA